jgi:tryptophan-rich sensory protein
MIEFPIQSLEGLIGTFIGLGVLVNTIIFGLDLNRRNQRGLPDGSIIGTVWLILIGCMAYAQWLTIKSCDIVWVQWLIPGLFFYCILYPVYTLGFRSKKISMITTVLAVFLSLMIVNILYAFNWIAAALIGLTTVWTLYVSYMTVSL